MVIALILVAWVVVNVTLLGVVAYANHRGRVRAAAPVVAVVAPARHRAPALAGR